MNISTSPRALVYEDQFSPRHDFPLVEAPRTYYVIASTPRCGSHLLGHTLFQTGVLGFPLEYFNPVNFPRWAERFGTAGFGDTYAAIRVRRTSPNGCFGTKLHFSHFAALAEEHPFERLFPDVRVVHVERDDLLGQAVSLAKARQTRSWISAQPVQAEPEYDAGAIEKAMRDIAGDNASWRLALGHHGWPFIRVTYEDFVRSPERVIEEVAAFVGVDLDRATEQAVLLPERQGDGTNGEWRARYLAEPKPSVGSLRFAIGGVRTRPKGTIRASPHVRALRRVRHVRSALATPVVRALHVATRFSLRFRR